MSTNKEYQIELQHQITGEMTAWQIANAPSPSVMIAIQRREEIRAKQEAFKNSEGKFDLEKLSKEEQNEFGALATEFDEISFRVLAMILTPAFALPQGVTKDTFLRECVGLYAVFDTVIAFFLSISSNYTQSPGAKDALSAASLSRHVTLKAPQASA